MNKKLPLFILSGFLGSGKTTFLKQWLLSENSTKTAVLVNEFGEVGLDHLILQEVNPETVLLPSGCVCCQIRGELKEALVSLLNQANKQQIPAFDRIVLETTGLADPAPIISTLLHDKLLQNHFVCGGVVTVVDAQHFTQQANNYPEWVKQVAAADALLLSKVDCVSEQVHKEAISYLKAMNTMAVLSDVDDYRQLSPPLFDEPSSAVASHLDQPLFYVQSNHPVTKTCVLTWDKQVNWSAFSIWLSLLLYQYGDKILRLKGLLITDEGQGIMIQGVQRNLYTPQHIEQQEIEQTKIVLITYDFDIEKISQSFTAFMTKYS